MGLFNKLFGKQQEEEKPFSIDISENGVTINGKTFLFPISVSVLNDIFGTSEIVATDTNNIHIWQDKGIRGFSNDKQNIFELDIQLVKTYAMQAFPQQSFTGVLTIEKNDYKNFVNISKADYMYKKLKVGKFNLLLGLTKEALKEIHFISISAEIETVSETSDKYKIEKTADEKIEFKDFNFKLAVIEELMYSQELLKPKFDVYEFAELYDKRKIDTDSEGYEPIPEVVQYFKNLEIDQSLAEHLTEIYQDGGNEIYMNIAPYWDGEDDAFDIHSYEDLKHFPNLKKMTLLCTDPKVFEELKTKGIDASAR